jgi:hypothetical protein
MKPTDGDFEGINLHGLEIKWLEFSPGCWEPRVELEDVTIYIERRNFYCDRGRYGFWAESKKPDKFVIDFADGFPRYFFSLQRAMDEMYDWTIVRGVYLVRQKQR